MNSRNISLLTKQELTECLSNLYRKLKSELNSIRKVVTLEIDSQERQQKVFAFLSTAPQLK